MQKKMEEESKPVPFAKSAKGCGTRILGILTTRIERRGSCSFPAIPLLGRKCETSADSCFRQIRELAQDVSVGHATGQALQHITAPMPNKKGAACCATTKKFRCARWG